MNKRMIGLVSVSLIVSIGVFVASCSRSTSSASSDATAKLQFSNKNGTSLTTLNLIERFFIPPAFAATTSQATAFKMKLIAAYLTEDIDPVTQNNSGNTQMFYLNPTCADDIMHCDISAGTAEDGQPMSKVITDYFDFAKTTDEVNAALNAQSRGIAAGNYKYVRLEFCKYNAGNSENIVWAGGNVLSEKSFKRNNCTVNSDEISPPLTVASGDAVTVKIEYDYSTSISVGADAQGDDCDGSDASKTCFTLPTFTPGAVN